MNRGVAEFPSPGPTDFRSDAGMLHSQTFCDSPVVLFGAWLVGRAVQTVLFEVPAFHPPSLAVAAAVLGTVSAAACLVPSYRAARISPMETMINE